MLDTKENELIALGASIASGCVPCTAFHLKAAAAMGIGSAEALEAIREAVRIREAATRIMAGHGGISPADPSSDGPGPGDRTLLLELVSVGAAYVVGCTASLQDHMIAARREGAGDSEILAALKIACAVRDVAGQKVEAAAEAFFGVVAAGRKGRARTSETSGCSCEKGDL
jgi:AhpD family alkylhydroperoxidase